MRTDSDEAGPFQLEAGHCSDLKSATWRRFDGVEMMLFWFFGRVAQLLVRCYGHGQITRLNITKSGALA